MTSNFSSHITYHGLTSIFLSYITDKIHLNQNSLQNILLKKKQTTRKLQLQS